ncbi:MAG: PAS domain-containing protein [Rhizobiales bacterium]|nr:PAS domain-containing protein [Hyphomicrobiales bacterium]
MRHASIRALYAYWLALSDGRPAPSRTEIDPRAVARELGDLFILDGDVESFAFRLAGSRLVHAMGRDVTGTAFLSIFDGASLKTAHAMLDCAAQEIEPVLIGVRDASLATPVLRPRPASPFEQLSRTFRRAGATEGAEVRSEERRQPFDGHGELLLLPLSHRGRVGARLFGALAIFNPPSEPPSQPLELAITGTRMIGRQSAPRQPLGLVSGAAADIVMTRRGHLAVLRGGRAE